MIYTLPTVTGTAGKATQFATTRTPFCWCIVTALAGNTGANLFVGGVNPTSKGASLVLASTTVGIPISKGSTLLIPGISAVTYGDLSTLWFDVLNTGDGISITYSIR